MRTDWFQVTTNLAVLVGLVLVVYEIRQNDDHKVAELGTASFEMPMNRLSASLGDDSSTIIAKAMTDPDNLTPRELIVVNAHHGHVYLELLHFRYMAAVGIYEGDSWKRDVRNIAIRNFAYPFGQKWWSQARENTNDAELVALIDLALAEAPDYRRKFFDFLGK